LKVLSYRLDGGRAAMPDRSLPAGHGGLPDRNDDVPASGIAVETEPCHLPVRRVSLEAAGAFEQNGTKPVFPHDYFRNA